MTRRHASHRLFSLFVIAVMSIGGLASVSHERAAAKTAKPSTEISAQLASSPAGEQLSWALEEINTGAGDLTADTIVERFSNDFLSALSIDDLIGVFTNYLAPAGPMTVARLEGGVTATRANALLIAANGIPWHVRLAIDGTEPHLINDLYFEPAYVPVEMDNPPGSWKTLDKQFAKVAPDVGFIAAEVTDGTCQPINGVNSDKELAIGSAFKLYVLGELARQIESGEASWDELLMLKPGLKSLPSGTMLYEPTGSKFPLEDYAERMVSISDNTATDHLISRLGRKNIEAMMTTMGHSNPDRNIPLLMTREWFAIKLRLTDDQIASYLAADVAGKRELLKTEVDPEADTLWDGEEWASPYLIDSVEWFASPSDLCHAVAYLHNQATQPGMEPIQNALSLDPGIAFDPAVWAYVGYKGGYETGVKSHVWLMERTDGRWFMMAAVINDPKKEINGQAMNQLMIPAAAFLAKVK